MNEEEWMEFQINCEYMDYSHPSATKYCLIKEKKIKKYATSHSSLYEKCDKFNKCPLMEREL